MFDVFLPGLFDSGMPSSDAVSSKLILGNTHLLGGIRSGHSHAIRRATRVLQHATWRNAVQRAATRLVLRGIRSSHALSSNAMLGWMDAARCSRRSRQLWSQRAAAAETCPAQPAARLMLHIASGTLRGADCGSRETRYCHAQRSRQASTCRGATSISSTRPSWRCARLGVRTSTNRRASRSGYGSPHSAESIRARGSRDIGTNNTSLSLGGRTPRPISVARVDSCNMLQTHATRCNTALGVGGSDRLSDGRP